MNRRDVMKMALAAPAVVALPAVAAALTVVKPERVFDGPYEICPPLRLEPDLWEPTAEEVTQWSVHRQIGWRVYGDPPGNRAENTVHGVVFLRPRADVTANRIRLFSTVYDNLNTELVIPRNWGHPGFRKGSMVTLTWRLGEETPSSMAYYRPEQVASMAGAAPLTAYSWIEA